MKKLFFVIGFALILSAQAFLAPPAAKADSITSGSFYNMTVEGYPSGENDGTYYIGDATIVISDLSNNILATFTDAYCVDFNHEITVPTTYEVQALAVDDLLPAPDISYNADAYLGSQFNGDATHDAPLQYAIWDISDSSVPYPSAETLESTALSAAATFNQPGTFAFIEQNNDGQTFEAYEPPSTTVTPEPSSLLLLGTGILGVAGAFKRRLNNADR